MAAPDTARAPNGSATRPRRIRRALVAASVLVSLAGCASRDLLGTSEFAQLPVIPVVPSTSLRDAMGDAIGPVMAHTPTAEERRALDAALASLPRFPANIHNGCHARAHYVYEQLERAAPGTPFKVWLFSGQLIAPMLSGLIRYPRENHATIEWNYHVVAAFRDERAHTRIIDPLFSREPLSIEAWIARLEIPPGAIRVEMPGSIYLFNRSEVPARDGTDREGGPRQHYLGRNVINGNFYAYDGRARAEHWAATSLALDRVATELEEGRFPACPWTRLLTRQIQLRRAVTRDATPAACEDLAEIYRSARETWISRGL